MEISHFEGDLDSRDQRSRQGYQNQTTPPDRVFREMAMAPLFDISDIVLIRLLLLSP